MENYISCKWEAKESWSSNPHIRWNQFSSVQSLSHIQLFATPWITASLSITNSRSSLKLMSIESVMPSSHLIFCRPLLLLPPIPPSIRVFSNESTLPMRWPKYWSFHILLYQNQWNLPVYCHLWNVAKKHYFHMGQFLQLYTKWNLIAFTSWNH